jgi:predicted DNA-binding transcriptional regulator AlpA
MGEILTADEVATMLKISKWQVYELVKDCTRFGVVREYPLPVLRFGASVRFLRKDVDSWVARLRNGEVA